MCSSTPFSLKGKRILVTGASSGIGKAVAIACNNMGASVYITGRDPHKLADTAGQMNTGETQPIVCDLTKREEVETLVQSLPKLDGIVHCAGIGHRKICKQITEDDIDTVMGINFKAPVLLQTEILKQKKINRGASIVFIASIASKSPSVGNAIYSASKGALISYSKCLEIELAPRQIRVNCISPAMVWTDLILKGGLTEIELKEDEKKYPLKRYGQPNDIAYLTLYLLSDASSWMTGSNIDITGGVG